MRSTSWLTLALVLSATHATAEEKRELRTFVYAQHPSNRYRLPRYPLAGSSEPGLRLCKDAEPAGLRFDPDDVQFHVDPVPSTIPKDGLRSVLKVRRGDGACFEAEVWILPPLVQTTGWRMAWSPDRPDAVDVVVPSEDLATRADVRTIHRVTFPWRASGAPGAWTDCEAQCRWRVPVDAADRAQFLRRSRVPVRLAIAPLEQLGARAGIFEPTDGSMKTRADSFNVDQWSVEPRIKAALSVSKGTLEVPLTFAGASALAPRRVQAVGGAQTPAQVVRTRSGPVLRFDPGQTSAPRTWLLQASLTPDANASAELKVEIVGEQSRTLRFVAAHDGTQVRLPTGIQACVGANAATQTLDMQAIGTARRMRYTTTGDCANIAGDLVVELRPPATRATDLTGVALDWRPEHPERIEVFVQSAPLLRARALREDTQLSIGTHPEGAWDRCTAEYCVFRIDGLSNARALTAVDLEVRSRRLGADRGRWLDAGTGRPFGRQHRRISAWRVEAPTVRVGVAVPAGAKTQTELSTVLDFPLARLLALDEAQPCDKATCFVRQVEGHLELQLVRTAAGANARTLAAPAAKLAGVTLVQIRGERWLGPKDIALQVELSSCKYTLEQLTRAYADFADAQVLFDAQLPAGQAARCPAGTWTVLAEGKPIGRAAVSEGRLEVALDKVPSLSSGSQTTTPLAFRYANGQAVHVESGGALVVEAAPSLGPLVVSARLPGGELRPLADRLAFGRPNIIGLDGLSNPAHWVVEVASARSTYLPCARREGISPEGEAADRALRFAPSDGGYCVHPRRESTTNLQLRATHRLPTRDLLRPGVNASALPPAALDAPRVAGWTTLDTQRAAKPWRLALDLPGRVKLTCGDRTVTSTSGRSTTVRYRSFESCAVRISLQVPDAAKDGASRPLDAFLAFYGEQRITIVGKKLGAGGDPTPLATVHIRRGLTALDTLSTSVDLTGVGEQPTKGYGEVDVTVGHDKAFYAADARWSAKDSTSTLRVRRGPAGPAWMAGWGHDGLGYRLYLSFTAAPFSIFRYPHSGRGAQTSAQARGLEKAAVAAGGVMTLEWWDFDNNDAVVPIINPAAQVGLLISSVPNESTLLDLPSLSLIAGLSLRTGVGVTPGDDTENALKTVIWYELLIQPRSRGNTPSHNLLFGFTVDIGGAPST